MATTTQNGGGEGSAAAGGAIVHIRADSDSTLEDLFDVVHKPQGSKRPLQVPLRMRNLPESFFRQPNFGSKSPNHSRENSTDLRENCSRSPAPPLPPPLPPPVHSRAHSSPASLQQTLAVAQQQQPGPHIRQSSYDVSSSSSASSGGGPDMGPLPPGWEIAKTPQGQIYFMNHIMKTTQWEDPRKQIHQLMLQQQMSAAAANNGSSSPRSSSSGSMSPVHSRSNSATTTTTTFGDPNGPLPHGWDQSETSEGEMYFINHATKKTTWFDPRIPIHHQRVPIRQAENAAQKRQQDMRLARLENERRAIQQRQAEIKRSMQSMRQHQEAMQQTQELLMRHNINESVAAASNGVSSSMDPFLSSSNAASSNEIHNRQESADSGLGMGSNFNLGSIPEDMTGMEMDTDLDATLTAPPTSAPSNQTSSSNSTAGAAVVASAATGDMDSDSLIPSLTSDIGGQISPDLMHDVHSLLGGAPAPGGSGKQVDNLTWL